MRRRSLISLVALCLFFFCDTAPPEIHTYSHPLSLHSALPFYRIDSYQKTYVVIDSFEQLMEATAPNFTPIYARLARQDSIPGGVVLDGDKVFNRGSGEGWPTDDDV